MFRSTRRRRSGLALMIVLSLLVLFLLMGVSFLMVAGQTEKGARIMAKTEQREDEPILYTEEVLYQILRDEVKEPSSLLRHSLLGDLYGNDSIDGSVFSAQAEGGGQFVLIYSQQRLRPGPPTNQPVDNYYAGRVLTMLNGISGTDGIRRKVKSTRIVASGRDASVDRDWVRVEAFVSNDTTSTQLIPVQGATFLINGRPFNGTGAGFNSSSFKVDRTVAVGQIPRAQVALLPHYVSGPAKDLANIGGEDESWDAVDYQNLPLSMVLPNASNSSHIIPSYHRVALYNYWRRRFATTFINAGFPPMPVRLADLVPSALRQNAIFLFPKGPDYGWGVAGVDDDNQNGVDDIGEAGMGDDPKDDMGNPIPVQMLTAIIELKRRIILRPLPEDHQGFDGGNPNMTYTGVADVDWDGDGNADPTPNGEWDVDNDNDGLREGIWKDAGFPVFTTRDGRSAKALVSITVKDLDGRLNVNAHGGGAHVRADYIDLSNSMLERIQAPYAAASNTELMVPRGRGYGPAEIYFGHVFTDGTRSAELSQILSDRYGGDNRAGLPNTNDRLSQMKTARHPNVFETDWFTKYLSPPDVWGLDAFALNSSGRSFAPFAYEQQTVDDPYELDLSRSRADAANVRDEPFTIAEFERLLRFNDIDSQSLPNRLVNAAFQSFVQAGDANRRRNLVTTESRHIPVPTGQPLISVLDLFKQKYTGSNFDAQAKLQLPFELRRGQLFDVNRLIGNGQDNNGNDVVDDPGEGDVNNINEHLIWAGLGNPQLPVNVTTAVFGYLNDETQNQAVQFSRYNRQIYARHLYCLMMLLIDKPAPANLQTLFPGVTNQTELDELFARRVAQWAINVVDFRDADSVMTPFEYDVDPFNSDGWDVNINGDPATRRDPNDPTQHIAGLESGDRRIVWGCEYPDLIIKEAGAFHDRRVKDTNADSDDGKYRKEGNQVGDGNLDQYRIPQGSLFIELFCPRNRVEARISGDDDEAYQKAPRELYTVLPDSSNQAVPFLDVGRMAVDPVTGKESPVWRIAISEYQTDRNLTPRRRAGTESSTISFQPEDMDILEWQNRLAANVQNDDRIRIERVIWFANRNPATAADLTTPDPNLEFAESNPLNTVYWNRNPNTYLPAGGYAVVGPRVTTHFGSKIPMNQLDLQTDMMAPPYEPADQRIDLTLNNGAIYRDKEGNLLSAVDNNQTQYALPIIAAANVPDSWVSSNPPSPADIEAADIGLGTTDVDQVGVGISLSEPLRNAYYREPTHQFAGFPVKDTYFDPTAAWDPALNALPDDPFDNQGGKPLADVVPTHQRTGTTTDFKTAFLQRLANPLKAYHATRNPYITVDWKPIDLTVFSGEEDTDRQFRIRNRDHWIDPSDPDPYGTGPEERFDSREKGKNKGGAGNLDDINIWTQDSTTPQPSVDPPKGRLTLGLMNEEYFAVDFRNTLGFLNQTYAGSNFPGPIAGGAAGVANVGTVTLPNPLNFNHPAYPGSTPSDRGNPSYPWPWLVWNNRPFDSPHELMNVPASSGNRLLHEFSVQVDDNNNGYTPYDTFNEPYKHLLNFYDISNTGSHFYRLFEYVGVRSPYVGTEKWYNPERFQNTNTAGANEFRPPYNYMSRFRDPGRININTIFDEAVVEGIAKAYPTMDPARAPRDTAQLQTEVLSDWRQLLADPGEDGGWGEAGVDDDGDNGIDDFGEALWPGTDDFCHIDPGVDGGWGEAGVDDDGMNGTDDFGEALWPGSDDLRFVDKLFLSRQGYGDHPNHINRNNSNYPTRFANPFRSESTADMMPISSLEQDGIDATLLRKDPIDPQRNPAVEPKPLFDHKSGFPFANTSRSPAFKNSKVQRLSNLLTTHSNVYAIWITVGFFEVDPQNPNLLRREIGQDTGEVKRHRAFYVIDRSIPVAYEPGQNHNVDDCVLIRRLIE